MKTAATTTTGEDVAIPAKMTSEQARVELLKMLDESQPTPTPQEAE